jgi:hypothetical protein
MSAKHLVVAWKAVSVVISNELRQFLRGVWANGAKKISVLKLMESLMEQDSLYEECEELIREHGNFQFRFKECP